MSKINEFGLSSEEYARVYDAWKHMISRCCDETDKSYPNYGGRGITVCDEWLKSFHAFASWAVSNGWSRGLTLERNDVNADYCPENCSWATRKQQGRNTRRNIKITIEGETKCLSEWCEILGFPYSRVRQRYTYSGIRDPKELFFDGDLRSTGPNILQISMDGEVVAEYVRVRDAANSSGIDAGSISRVLSGRRKSTGGYCWKYETEEM